MPRGDKSSYSSKQKRQARHIEKSYERRGLSSGEAARRAWATVNERTGGARGGSSSSRGPSSSRKAKAGGRSRSRSVSSSRSSGSRSSRSRSSRSR